MDSRAWQRAGMVVALATAMTTLSAAPPASADVAAHVTAYEHFDYVPGPGGGLVLDFGYTPRNISVPHGSTVRWTSESGQHTVTVAADKTVPKTIDEIFGCFAPGALCDTTLAAHDPGNDQKPPFNKAVNVGRTGLNQQGDSRLFDPKHPTVATVTAPAGAKLHYICVIHPWMQATINVT